MAADSSKIVMLWPGMSPSRIRNAAAASEDRLLAGFKDYLSLNETAIPTGDDDLLVLKRLGRCRIVTPRQFWSLMHNVKQDRNV